MKNIKLLSIVALLIGSTCMVGAFASHKQSNTDNKEIKEDNTSKDKGFAVVELFTSEGCSSCPAADEVVARVQKELKDEPVYILAFHVDYWNRLGWKDAFSSADYSHRQNQYAQWLSLESVYTPQIVVNGTTEFVGSDNAKLHNAIKSDLQADEKSQVSLDNLKASNGQASIDYKVENPTQNTSIVLAVVQKSAQTKVKGGENSGRLLSHVQIVRTVKTVSLNGKNSGAAQLDLPAGIDTKEFEVIAFLQNSSNGNITAATKTAFTN